MNLNHWAPWNCYLTIFWPAHSSKLSCSELISCSWSSRPKMLPQMLPLLDDPWRLHWRQLWRTVAVEWCWGCCWYILWYIFSVFILILIYHPRISCRTLACSMEFSAWGWWRFTFHCYRKGYSQLTDWICHRGQWMTTEVVCKILGFKTLTQCLRFNAEGNGKSKNLKVAMILYGSIGKELGEFKEWSEVPGSRWKVIMWMVYFVEQTFWSWTLKLAWSGSDRRHSGLPVRLTSGLEPFEFKDENLSDMMANGETLRRLR